MKLYRGEKLDFEQTSRDLIGLGYERRRLVEEIGDFAIRGDILDIYPVTFELPIRLELEEDRLRRIFNFDPITQNKISEHEIAIILPARRGGAAVKRGRPAPSEEMPIQNFVDLEPGDYVVHVNFGIGIYIGLEKMPGRGEERAIAIEYQGGDKLYVPLSDMHLVQKYTAFGRRPPKLFKLGSKLWKRVKDNARRGISNLAFELLELQAMRSSRSGYRFSSDTDWQKELEGSFPYEETEDQRKATVEVKSDMERVLPMDRLIVGDVGYGKTEVALRAAFKAVMDNKQVAMLVPTTILAEQHFITFKERLANFPVSIQMLSRFRRKGEQAAIIEDIAAGRIDIIIGTHRLLSADLKFKDLELIIIDEEQRFGVKDKERLKKLKLTVDVLTLSATPIPRTLYMALMGARDMSTINTPPQNRLPITTNVVEYDEELIGDAIKRELARGGQVYFVHNRVKGIQKVAAEIRRLIPDARIDVAHGRMNEQELELSMQNFIRHNTDVLVATTIIESGIDIPNANTLFVNRADLFGLADLYQLRGRIGRFNKRAFAYFLVPKGFGLTADSKKRLSAIESATSLGAGFRIAMEDLQIRGAGNLLGKEQHGYINNIGFDLYCRLLREMVSKLSNSRQ